MRWTRALAALLIVLLLPLAAPDARAAFLWPFGQKVPKKLQAGDGVAGMSHVDSTARPIPVEQGYLPVKEVSPAQTFLGRHIGAINNRLVVGNYDSTNVENTVGANHIYALVSLTPDSATCSTVWAFKWRRHEDTFNDSVSTWRVTPNPVLRVQTTASTFIANGSTDTTLGGTAMPQTAISTTALNHDEVLFAIPNNLTGNGRNQWSFELYELGHPFTAEKMSFYVRPLVVNGTTACTARAGASCSIRVDLVWTR